MVDAFIFFMSLLFFAAAARGLMLAITQNVRLEALAGVYTLRALRLGRTYKITAWSILASTLFCYMAYTFVIAIIEI